MAAIELRQVSKSLHGKIDVVSEVSLTVDANAWTVILGPNGSGKTTLLRLIAGLDQPTTGQVWIDGREMSRTPPSQRGVGLVFQEPVFYPHQTVRQQLQDGLATAGWFSRLSALGRSSPKVSTIVNSGCDEQLSRWDATVKMLAIEHLLDRYPRQLSGGERQRVALCRVLIRRPAVFLLDEPLSNLDLPTRRQLTSDLLDCRQQFMPTAVMVTHDPADAWSFGDKVVVLQHGRVQQVGPVDEIYRRPTNRWVAEMIGEGQVNWLNGRIESDSGELVFRFANGCWRVPPECCNEVATFRSDDQVWLGARSELMSLGEKSNEWVVTGTVAAVSSRFSRLSVTVEVADFAASTKRTRWTFITDKNHELGETVNMSIDPRRCIWLRQDGLGS